MKKTEDYKIETTLERSHRDWQIKTSMQQRYLWMTQPDWQALSDALVEAYPGACYWLTPEHSQKVIPGVPPSILLFNDLMTAYDNRHLLAKPGKERPWWRSVNISLIFGPNWQPDFVRHMDYLEKPDDLRWLLYELPYPMVSFRELFMVTPEALEAPPRVPLSPITFHALKNDKEHDALRRQFFRLLGKYCSNRNQARYRMPERKLVVIKPRAFMFWMGRDARARALANPDLFFYDNQGFGTRPSEGVTETPEYQPDHPTRAF